MSTAGPSVRAVAATAPRVRGVDVARAVALLAMMGTHLLPELDARGHSTPFAWVASGRASALFAVLAGVGLALATGGERPRLRPLRATTTQVVVRALLIAAVGLWLVDLDPPVAVILVCYGLLFVLALPLLGLRPGPLLALAAGWAVLVPCLSFWWRGALPPGPGPQVGLADLAEPVDALTRLALTGYYPVLTWLAYLLAGLAVGRLPLRSPAVARRLLVGGVVLAASSWALSWVLVTGWGWRAVVAAGRTAGVGVPEAARWLQLDPMYGTTPTTTWWWLTAVTAHSGTPFDVLHTIGSAWVVLALSLLAWDAVQRRGLLVALASAGSMPLSLYTAHVVVTDALHPEPGPRPASSGWLEYGVQVGAALLLATLWRRYLARGPLEEVVHRASRGAAAVVSRTG